MFTRCIIPTTLTGSCLLFSNSLWLLGRLFNPPVQIQTPRININARDADGSVLPTAKSKNRDYSAREVSSGSIYVHQSSPTLPRYFLSPINVELDQVFTLPFEATEEEYESIRREDIKIKLFKSPAWRSEGSRDEYHPPLKMDKVNQLFDGADELKTKQLLLSLLTRKEWSTYTEQNIYFWPGHTTVKPRTLEDLRDLKIKYFGDFDSLRNYVRSKVALCGEENKICVARREELNVMDQDEISFFDPSSNNFPKYEK